MLVACNFTNIVRGIFQACHLDYSADHSQQSRGLMQKVVQVGVAYMFGVEGLHRTMANQMSTNVRSENLLRTLDIEREEYAKACLKIARNWQDHVLNLLVNPQ